MKTCVLMIASFCCFVVCGNAQSVGSGLDPKFRDTVDGLMQSFLQEHAAPGAIVAISSHGHRAFYAYGRATDAGAAFTPSTLVEIGSCTKVFTTTLFAEQVNNGNINPNAPLQQYLPSAAHLRGLAQSLTPLELATFTSGMPENPTDLPNQLRDRNIRNYSTDDFFHWLSHWQGPTILPAPYVYSNASVGLLGYVVEHTSGQPWETYLEEQILQPLGMSDTETRPSARQRQFLADGHFANGSPAPEWPYFAWFAAGALRSTPTDMLRFGEANLLHTSVDGHAVPPSLTAAMRLAQTPDYTLPNGNAEQAMAWVVNHGDRPGLAAETFKNGGTAGFSSVILTNKPKDLVIFIVLNVGKANPAGLAIRMGRLLP